MMFGHLISSCCSSNPHGKAGNEKKERKFWRPLENIYPFKSRNNQVGKGIFNQQVLQENFFQL